MAYTRPRDLDGFCLHLSKADTKFRQQLGTDLLAFLAEPSNPIDCQDIGLFIDGLISWMQSSNYKVSSNGIEILTYLVDRLGTDFRPYIQTVLPNVIDRLGDAKDSVREKSQLLILKLLERNVLTPQNLIEKLQSGFTHKNAKIREEILRCLMNTLNEHGAHSITLNKFIPDIVNLLSDPTASVRDTAFNTLVELFKHVGEKLRSDLQRRNIVPQGKWQILSAKFDEVKARGQLLQSAYNSDEIDRAVMAKPMVPPKKPLYGTLPKARSGIATPSSANTAGAVDEESFIKSFEECPSIQLYHAREVTEQLKTIQEIISDSNKEWNKRVEALKKIRSLIVAGATNHEEFYVGLKNLEIPLQNTLKDLRSQVVREACITVSYLSKSLVDKFDKTAELLLQPLINLIQNSAKVMASCGYITIKFIIRYTHSSRLIPIIANNSMKSKSKEIRRACCEFLEMVLDMWPKHPLERQILTLKEAIKVGIGDADPEARVCSRRAFKGFKDHFPDQAEQLLQSLDAIYRKALQSDGISCSSSQNNIASGFKTPRNFGRSATTSAAGSTENLAIGGTLQRVPSLPRTYRQRSGIPILTKDNSGRKGFRSNSAIDLQAAQRAKARALYTPMTRTKIQSGTASLPRRKRSTDVTATPSPERTSRARGRKSQSQPTSRSGSPSSPLAYIYNRTPDHESRRTRISSIPRSTQNSRDASRETSPNRNSNRYRRSNDRPPMSPASRPVLAQKILQQSREAENALANVFHNLPDPYRSPRTNMRSLDNQSDESETSSACSERSERCFEGRKSFDSYSWSGSQQRLSRDLWEPARDINQIIAMCASTNWQERKDGLISLQHYLTCDVPLTQRELKHLTEIFTRMFMDSHTKGLSVFLDTLHEVIRSYRTELEFWLYVLLQRVFFKIGTETLTSIQGKLMSTLDLIKISFPIKLLISNVYRFLIDATQTPNSKVKTHVLTTLSSLCNNPDAAQFISQPPASQALSKIIMYAQDTKSAETRHAARQCIVSLWNCNTPQVTMMLADLPKELQDLASSIVHTHMRKNSTGGEPGSPMSPKVLSPLKDGDDHEEIQRKLRKTTAEIQNYPFETLSNQLDRDRDTTSQDSGISQMSAGCNDVAKDLNLIEEQMEDLSIRPNFNVGSGSGSRSLPYSAVNGVSNIESNGFRSLGVIKDPEQIVSSIIEHCYLVDVSIEEKRSKLSQLYQLIESGQVEHVKKKFKKVLRILIECFKDSDATIQITALQTVKAIFLVPDMRECWINFLELVTMRVLEAHNDDKKEVVKEAEITAAALVMCPFEELVKLVAPIICTYPYPVMLGAIKMLTKLIEAHPNKVTDEHLLRIMPGLIKGSDHQESTVRKGSIFCMVALYKAVGEERLSYYIQQLPGSKVRLLMLYIQRSITV